MKPSTPSPDEDELMDVKLALVGLAIWSNNQFRTSHGQDARDRDEYAIVHLDTQYGGGHFAFREDHSFYKSRREAFKAAIELLAAGAKKTDH